ncbi:hypothetical protein Tco_0601799 [Tanacetum coccineum]
MEERAKFLHDTIAAQRRFLAEQRAAAIRNKPPIRTQLRSKMMTYLKHVGNKKHSDLKNKTFEEIQALYEKVKRFDESFTVISSNEDARKIKEINEGASDPDKKKKFVKEDVLTMLEDDIHHMLLKDLEQAYYTQFGAPYQPGGQYRAAELGFYQRNNGNSSYPNRRPSLEESLTKFMTESAKRHDENSNQSRRSELLPAIRNQGASIKTLEIQIGQMSKVLKERGFGSLPSSTKTKP